MTIDEMIAVLQAAKSGKRVEFIEVGNGRFWCEFSDTKDFSAWNFSKYKYRVKPEPREFWAYLDGTDSLGGRVGSVFELTTGTRSSDQWVKVREVME